MVRGSESIGQSPTPGVLGEPLHKEQRRNERLPELPWNVTGLSRQDQQQASLSGRRGSSVIVWTSRWRVRLESWQLLLIADPWPGAFPSFVAQAGAGGIWLDEGCEFLTLVFSRSEGKRALRAQKSSPPASSSSRGAHQWMLKTPCSCQPPAPP